MSKYFGFAIADGMFNAEAQCVHRRIVTADYVRFMIEAGGVIPALNPSHLATINAMRVRFGIEIEIPEKAPHVALERGDTLYVMSVRGLPRLGADRHEYTQQEIDEATFIFSEYNLAYHW